MPKLHNIEYKNIGEMIFISKADFNEACQRWQKACQRTDTQALFEKYLGMTVAYASRGDNQFLFAHKRSEERLQLLLGPHHHAIIKTWVIKHYG